MLDAWLWRDVALAIGAALLGGALTLLFGSLSDKTHDKQEATAANRSGSPLVPPRPPGLTHFLAATAAATADTVVLAAAADTEPAQLASNQSLVGATDPSVRSQDALPSVPLRPTPVAPPPRPPDPALKAESKAESEVEKASSKPVLPPISAPSVTLGFDIPNAIVTRAIKDVALRPEIPNSIIPPPPPPTHTDEVMVAERLARHYGRGTPPQWHQPVRPRRAGRTAGPILPQIRQRDRSDILGTGPDFAQPSSVWRPPTTRFLSSLVSEPGQVQGSQATITVATPTAE